jgi:hypothetical protein
MKFALFVLLISPLDWYGYMDFVCSRLGVAPTPQVSAVFEAESDPGLAWVLPGRDDVVVVQKWVFKNADKNAALYLVAHEACHIKLRHNHRQPQGNAAEEEADACARKLFGARWPALQKAMRRLRYERRKAIQSGELEKVVLPSR